MTNKVRVLFVDDDEHARSQCKTFLEDYGYELVLADSAEEAKKYSDEQFDIAIIDGLGGRCFELIKEIKAERKVIVSGTEEIVNMAKKQGIKAYLKPQYIMDIIEGKATWNNQN